MLNPAKLLKLKTKWEAFAERHPKFLRFLQYVGSGTLKENDVLEMIVRSEDGTEVKSNLRLTAEDIALFSELKALLESEKKN